VHLATVGAIHFERRFPSCAQSRTDCAPWASATSRSPWQNGFAERLIGSIRRECVDHLVALGEAPLRRILTKYVTYYNELRTHRSLNKDAPIHRAIQHVGRIVSAPVLGGLHHHYRRI
jgi:transposase InsO family protein